ncbi:MAG: DegV family protein, partial [Firmicutes bacterium]|nr:DegV family protein [Bacillota bacterium]
PGLVKNTYVFFSIEHLDLLERGGRIGKASSLLGTIMKIHPILSFDRDGELYNIAKVRGKAKLPSKLTSLVEKMKEENPGMKYIAMIADGNAKEELKDVRSHMKEAFPDPVYFMESEIGATLSCYIGDGVLGAGIQFLED